MEVLFPALRKKRGDHNISFVSAVCQVPLDKNSVYAKCMFGDGIFSHLL